MAILTVKKLEDTLSELAVNGKKPEKILLGYKAYGKLMNDRGFFEEVAGSAMDPNKRKYKNIKIKVTQDEHQLEVKCSKEQIYIATKARSNDRAFLMLKIYYLKRKITQSRQVKTVPVHSLYFVGSFLMLSYFCESKKMQVKRRK